MKFLSLYGQKKIIFHRRTYSFGAAYRCVNDDRILILGELFAWSEISQYMRCLILIMIFFSHAKKLANHNGSYLEVLKVQYKKQPEDWSGWKIVMKTKWWCKKSFSNQYKLTSEEEKNNKMPQRREIWPLYIQSGAVRLSQQQWVSVLVFICMRELNLQKVITKQQPWWSGCHSTSHKWGKRNKGEKKIALRGRQKGDGVGGNIGMVLFKH